jgi:hypothetical protein
MWAWDIEATDWDRVVCCTAVSSGGDVERFYGPDSLARLSTVMDQAKGTWGAHAGGIYDTLLLLNEREEPFKELVLSGTAVLTAKDGALAVRDTFRWWLAGLASVGKAIDKAATAEGSAPPGYWLKKEVDRTRIHDLTADETIAYCEHDSRILLEGMRRALAYLESQNARPSWTAGASALNLLAAIEPEAWRLLDRFRLDFETAVEARNAVRGARVESFAAGRVSPVFVYDFKSAYPSAYLAGPIPIGCRPARASDAVAVWRCRWRWPWRERLPPVLDQATNAGAGWCEAWCVSEEIEDLERAGAVVDRLQGFAGETVQAVGQDFARRLYDQKEAGSFFAKVFLNGLAGKYSENPVREKWTSIGRPVNWYGPEPVLRGQYWHCHEQNVDKHGKTPRHLQPLAAATILGRARSKLYRALAAVIAAGGRIFYSDTDSIHCDRTPEQMAAIAASTGAFRLGQSLGELNPEGGPYEGVYLGPKAYCLLDASGVAQKGALKGVPWNALRNGTEVDGVFQEARGPDGRDTRREVFDRALKNGTARIAKAGISSFVSGLKRPAGWGRAELVRTIRPYEKTKATAPNSADWAYRTPAEVAVMTPREELEELAEYEPGIADE